MLCKFITIGRQVCTRTGDADDMMGDDDDDVLFESQILDFLDHIESTFFYPCLNMCLDACVYVCIVNTF